MDEIVKMLQETGMPFAYDHFAEGENPKPPYICYLLPTTNNFSADGKVYQPIEQVHIEMYTDRKDPLSEKKITAVLDKHGIFYNQTETWIESEKLYEVMFTFEVLLREDTGNA